MYSILLSIEHEPDVESVMDVRHKVDLGEESDEFLHGQDMGGVHHVLLVVILLVVWRQLVTQNDSIAGH